MRARIAALLVCLALAAAVAAQPSGGNVAHYDVFVDRDVIHVLIGTGKKGAPDIALWHVRSADGGAIWSKPARVNRQSDRLSAHHPGENPQIAAMDDRVVVVWTQQRPGSHHGGALATAISDDGGTTWKPGATPTPPRAGSQTFAEFASDGKTLHMAWLDSRDGRQGLRYARSTDRGDSWAADRALAPRTCDCCWNSLTPLADGGVAVFYRADEPRDMMLLTSRTGEAWRNHGSIGQFNWQVRGCPHVGGALVARHNTIHTLVWNGKDDTFGLYAISSTDAGTTWSRPRKLGTDDARNADLAVTESGELHAVWDESGPRTSAIQKSRSTDGGQTWTAPERIAAGAELTYPRTAATRHGVAVFWLDGSPRRGSSIVVNGKPLPAP
jgi:BNR repeat-like domain